MRTIDQAREVAKIMEPVNIPGKATEDGAERANIHQHLFVGANVNTAAGFGASHAEAARKRLQSAATIALKLPEKATAGKELALDVLVTNVGAGHAIPSSITELREVWIELIAMDNSGSVVYRSGDIRKDGSVDPEAVMYHSILHDKEGKKTYLPWRAIKIAKEHLIPPKQTITENYKLKLPRNAVGNLTITAKLRYRAAPQNIMDELFEKGTFNIEVVDMAAVDQTITVSKAGFMSLFRP